MNNTPEVAELIQMVDGIYVRTYDRRLSLGKKTLVQHFQAQLKKDQWEVLVKIKEDNEMIEIDLLFDEDKVYGIFITIIPERSDEVTFVNIVGEIAPGTH